MNKIVPSRQPKAGLLFLVEVVDLAFLEVSGIRIRKYYLIKKKGASLVKKNNPAFLDRDYEFIKKKLISF